VPVTRKKMPLTSVMYPKYNVEGTPPVISNSEMKYQTAYKKT